MYIQGSYDEIKIESESMAESWFYILYVYCSYACFSN